MRIHDRHLPGFGLHFQRLRSSAFVPSCSFYSSCFLSQSLPALELQPLLLPSLARSQAQGPEPMVTGRLLRFALMRPEPASFCSCFCPFSD